VLGIHHGKEINKGKRDARWDEGSTAAKAEIGRPAKVIATGGLALLFEERIELFDAVEPDLTLQGLAILAERAAAR